MLIQLNGSKLFEKAAFYHTMQNKVCDNIGIVLQIMLISMQSFLCLKGNFCVSLLFCLYEPYINRYSWILCEMPKVFSQLFVILNKSI